MTAFVMLACMVMTFSASSTDIEAFCAKEDKVESAVCLVVGDRAVVAMRTEPFITRSERQAFLCNESEKITGEYGLSEVYISFDTDIYGRILLYKEYGKGSPSEILELARSRSAIYCQTASA